MPDVEGVAEAYVESPGDNNLVSGTGRGAPPGDCSADVDVAGSAPHGLAERLPGSFERIERHVVRVDSNESLVPLKAQGWNHFS